MTHTAKEQFEALHRAYDYFNTHLFAGELPPCMLNFSKAGRRTMGFYAEERWQEAKTDTESEIPLSEISLCPQWINRDAEDVFSTLVHEMVHHWQYTFGRPSRNGYHNKQWAYKMMSIGLFPSDTGQKGGKITGQSMSHCILPEGLFAQKFKEMPEDIRLPFVYVNPYSFLSLGGTGNGEEIEEGDEGGEIASNKNKIKYFCPVCEINVWGKPDLRIMCGECRHNFIVKRPVKKRSESYGI